MTPLIVALILTGAGLLVAEAHVASYGALGAALRSNPALVPVADHLDYLVAASKQDRATFFQQLNATVR